MNGEPLPPEHGFPVRLIAPGWYGVANVKWLTRIEVLDQRFANKFMARDYVSIRRLPGLSRALFGGANPRCRNRWFAAALRFC
jgi:DMSO/TMAO reductase YedYZ molybdopterin-dependent catalytic subunit